MPEKIAPIPLHPVNNFATASLESRKLVVPWRSAITSNGGKDPDPDSSFLAERGHLRRPHSV